MQLAKYPQWETYPHRIPPQGFIQYRIAFLRKKSSYLGGLLRDLICWSYSYKRPSTRRWDNFVPTWNLENISLPLFLTSGTSWELGRSLLQLLWENQSPFILMFVQPLSTVAPPPPHTHLLWFCFLQFHLPVVSCGLKTLN